MTYNDYLKKGIKYSQEDNNEKALENFEMALELQSNNKDLKRMVKRLKTKLIIIEHAKQSLLKEIESRTKLFGIMYGITDIKKAITKFTKYLETNSKDKSIKSALASAYYIRGMMYAYDEDHARAIKNYSEAIKYEPKYAFAINKRAMSYSKIKNFNKAIEDYKKLVKLDPSNSKSTEKLANAYLERGISYDRKRNYAKAISDLEKVLEIKDDDTTRKILALVKQNMKEESLTKSTTNTASKKPVSKTTEKQQ